MKFEEKELILFDLDGTLIDSVPDLATAINRMLHTLGRATFSEDTIRHWVGNGAQMLVKRALSSKGEIDEGIDEALFTKAMESFLGFYGNRLCHDTQPYPNVRQTLHSLKSLGYRMAIVTNKPFGFVAPILQGLELDGLFELVVGGDTLAVKKPNPLPLLHVCQTLHVDTAQCVMVGDSNNDMLAAKAAGMQSIGVTYGYNYGEDIAVNAPDVVCDDFGDILACFER